MEKIIAKMESLIEKMIEEFKTHPFKTAIIALIFYWLVKTVYKEVKGNDQSL